MLTKQIALRCIVYLVGFQYVIFDISILQYCECCLRFVAFS